MKTILTTVLAGFLGVTPAHAEKAARIMQGGGNDCVLKENVTIGVSFNQKVGSFAEAKGVFESMAKQVEDFAKQQELKKFTLQNQNYNIYSQPQGYMPDGTTPLSFTYQVNGTMSYQLDNTDAAFKFAELLTQKKMQVNVSSNSYRQGNCN